MKFIGKLLPLLVIALGVLIAVLIFINKPTAKRRPSLPKILTVETLTLQPQSHTVQINTQGTVEPRTSTTLIPRVSGEIIKVARNFRPGGFFEPGETLLTIDPTDYRLSIKAAEADLAEARFNYEEAKARAKQAADNWKRLGRTEKPSDLVLHKPQLARASARVDSAQAQLQKAQLDLKRTQIKSPYAGRILEQFVDIGQYVSPGNQLAKLFAIDYVEIRLPISERQRAMIDLPRLYRGDKEAGEQQPKATVSARIAGRQYQWQGRVVRTEGSVDRATRQVFVIVQVDNPYQRHADERPPLEIGQFVNVSIAGKTLQQIYPIPRSAVQGNNLIMLVNAENRLQRKSIDVIWETEQSLFVREGLQAGDKICTTYVPFAADNAEVQIAGEPGKGGERAGGRSGKPGEKRQQKANERSSG